MGFSCLIYSKLMREITFEIYHQLDVLPSLENIVNKYNCVWVKFLICTGPAWNYGLIPFILSACATTKGRIGTGLDGLINCLRRIVNNCINLMFQ